MPISGNLVIGLILSFLSITKSQVHDTLNIDKTGLDVFVSVNYGYQVSGIKSEDFLSSNYSPLLNITAGKWIMPSLALQIGYKGFYFYYIGDDVKHHYNFLYGGVVLNFNNAVKPQRFNSAWSLLLHAGAGYFYNHVYGRSSICANIGIQNTYKLTDQFHLSLDIASIIGWDIYQGDEDILPGITVGVIYFFVLE